MKRWIKAAAKEAIVLDNTNNYIIASQISLNLKGEWDAIEGYDKLIPFFEAAGDQQAIDQIREIISDEKNHADVLEELLKKYDDDIPVNPT